jgi:hypothetical protein
LFFRIWLPSQGKKTFPAQGLLAACFSEQEEKPMIKTNLSLYRQLAWLGVGILGIAVIFAFLQGKVQGGFTLIAFLVAALAFMGMQNRLPSLFDLLFVIAALLNAGGWVWNLFERVGPYDEITHAFTSFAVTLALSFWVYGALLTSFYSHRLLYVLAIASFGISIGVMWEFVEWAIGVIDSLQDTLIDLVMDSIGATLAAVISLVALRERRFSSGRRPPQQLFS